MSVLTTSPSHPRRRADEVQYRLVYYATFPVFVLTALACRVLPRERRGRTDRGSVVGEARTAARTCGSFALMG